MEMQCCSVAGAQVDRESVLPLERGINCMGSSTLLGQPNTTQNQKAVPGKGAVSPCP